MNDKENFVIEYLAKEQFVDVLNQDFMTAFAIRFDCRVFRQTIEDASDTAPQVA